VAGLRHSSDFGASEVGEVKVRLKRSGWLAGFATLRSSKVSSERQEPAKLVADVVFRNRDTCKDKDNTGCCPPDFGG
jgi:hypothetical protein